MDRASAVKKVPLLTIYRLLRIYIGEIVAGWNDY